MDIRDLAILLGPGVHDIAGRTLVISDGAGKEVEVEIESGDITVTDVGFEE